MRISKHALLWLGLAGIGVFFAFNQPGLRHSFFGHTNPVYDQESLEILESLPYLAWAPIPSVDVRKTGVTYNDTRLTCPGYNLYHSAKKPEALLMDMQGRIVHRWDYPLSRTWNTTHLDQDGNLFFIEEGKSLGKLDWASRTQWVKPGHFHHWIDIAENGDIYTLVRRKRDLHIGGEVRPVWDDLLTVLSPQGTVKKQVSLYDAMIGHEWLARVHKKVLHFNKPRKRHELLDYTYELFHANSVEYIDRDIAGFSRAGDVLISIKKLDLLAVIDMQNKQLRWAWGDDQLKWQHSALLLASGNVLVFDNGRRNRRFSRVIELEPSSKRIIWEYRGDPPESLYAPSQSGCQRLPNGNTLMTIANRGYVFEVTPDKKVVWEFFNPDIGRYQGKDNQRGSIYRMTRYPESIFD